MADLSASADPSLMISGSVSRGLDMPRQNDWFGGPGGRMDGMGGPGGSAVWTAWMGDERLVGMNGTGRRRRGRRAADGRTRRPRRTGRTGRRRTGRRPRWSRWFAGADSADGVRRTVAAADPGGGGRGGRGGGRRWTRRSHGTRRRDLLRQRAPRSAHAGTTATLPSAWITPRWTRAVTPSTARRPPSRRTPRAAAASCSADHSRSPNCSPDSSGTFTLNYSMDAHRATAPPARRPCPRCSNVPAISRSPSAHRVR